VARLAERLCDYLVRFFVSLAVLTLCALAFWATAILVDIMTRGRGEGVILSAVTGGFATVAFGPPAACVLFLYLCASNNRWRGLSAMRSLALTMVAIVGLCAGLILLSPFGLGPLAATLPIGLFVSVVATWSEDRKALLLRDRNRLRRSGSHGL
jgi:hypothetical protein